jgi:predicted aspartyl protease
VFSLHGSMANVTPMDAMGRLATRRWLGGVTMAAALIAAAGDAGKSSPFAGLSPPIPGSSHAGVQRAADGTGACGALRLGETAVATLRNAPIITLFANDAAVTLLLDTGAQTTILAPAAAQRVSAQRPRIEFQRQMRGIAGSLQTGEVELRSFTIGGVAVPWRRVRVAPVFVASVFATPLDGVLGADTLSSFDVDLDLPGHRMVLYEKQTCAGAAPAWSGPYITIAAGRSLGDHLFFPVQLDGRSLAAFIDTGAQFSVLSAKAAAALGVSEAILARDHPVIVHGAAAEQLNAHLHRFSQLAIGPEVIRNPEIVVADLRLSDADLVLGIDFLKSRRMWMSYGSRQIFLSRRI